MKAVTINISLNPELAEFAGIKAHRKRKREGGL
jgi:hypothetical protein